MKTIDQYNTEMPHDLQAEMAAISAATIDPLARAEILSILNPASFFLDDHRIIFGALVDMERRGRKVDYVTLTAELKARKLLEDIGGLEKVFSLFDTLPTAIHARHYAEIVQEHATRRAIIDECNKAISLAFSPRSEPFASELALATSSKFIGLSTDRSAMEPVSFGESAVEFIDALDATNRRAIPTGITSLDDRFRGLERGQMMLIGGEPGHGKSALAKQIVFNAAKAGIRCGVISLEESAQKITRNYFAGAAGVENKRLAAHSAGDPTITAAEHDALIRELNGAMNLPIFTIKHIQTLEEVEAAIQILASKCACELIIVDHLHLIQVSGERSREQEVAKASQSLKLIFRRLELGGIVCCQLNRSHENGAPPTTRSLRDSGSLTADGDIILLLHFPDACHRGEKGYIKTNELQVVVAKDKDSGGGLVTLEFNTSLQLIRDLVPI